MAKSRKQDDFDDRPRAGLVELPEDPPIDVEAQEPDAPAIVVDPSRYRVTLVCPTPLLHRTLEVEALDETQAKAAFMRANGISDSVHPWTVEKLP